MRTEGMSRARARAGLKHVTPVRSFNSSQCQGSFNMNASEYYDYCNLDLFGVSDHGRNLSSTGISVQSA